MILVLNTDDMILESHKVTNLDPAPAESLTNLLGAHSLIAVSCQYREHLHGRSARCVPENPTHLILAMPLFFSRP